MNQPQTRTYADLTDAELVELHQLLLPSHFGHEITVDRTRVAGRFPFLKTRSGSSDKVVTFWIKDGTFSVANEHLVFKPFAFVDRCREMGLRY